MNLKKLERYLRSKFVGTGPSFYKKRIYRVAVSQMLRNTGLRSVRYSLSVTGQQVKFRGNIKYAKYEHHSLLR